MLQNSAFKIGCTEMMKYILTYHLSHISNN